MEIKRNFSRFLSVGGKNLEEDKGQKTDVAKGQTRGGEERREERRQRLLYLKVM